MERKGIAIAGNIVTDIVKNIDRYPEIGTLSNISSVSRSVGGSVPNVGIDLSVIDPAILLSAIGRIGDDDNGRYVLSRLKSAHMDVSRVTISTSAPTSFSDVMNLPGGERTFFHARGANAEFDPSQIDLESLDCRLLHIAYILLLDRFDAPDAECGTVMAAFLKAVRKRGIETSVDMVSDASRNARIALPALKFCDYFIVNEIECCSVWGIEPRNASGELNVSGIRTAMENAMTGGVHKKVIVHAPEACFCLDRNGSFSAKASLEIPEGRIKGSVGAGDAFCAGALWAICNGLDDEEMLTFALSAAAFSLFEENAVDGMRSKDEIMKLSETCPSQHIAGLESF